MATVNGVMMKKINSLDWGSLYINLFAEPTSLDVEAMIAKKTSLLFWPLKLLKPYSFVFSPQASHLWQTKVGFFSLDKITILYQEMVSPTNSFNLIKLLLLKKFCVTFLSYAAMRDEIYFLKDIPKTIIKSFVDQE